MKLIRARQDNMDDAVIFLNPLHIKLFSIEENMSQELDDGSDSYEVFAIVPRMHEDVAYSLFIGSEENCLTYLGILEEGVANGNSR